MYLVICLGFADQNLFVLTVPIKCCVLFVDSFSEIDFFVIISWLTLTTYLLNMTYSSLHSTFLIVVDSREYTVLSVLCHVKHVKKLTSELRHMQSRRYLLFVLSFENIDVHCHHYIKHGPRGFYCCPNWQVISGHCNCLTAIKLRDNVMTRV